MPVGEKTYSYTFIKRSQAPFWLSDSQTRTIWSQVFSTCLKVNFQQMYFKLEGNLSELNWRQFIMRTWSADFVRLASSCWINSKSGIYQTRRAFCQTSFNLVTSADVTNPITVPSPSLLYIFIWNCNKQWQHAFRLSQF